MYCGQCGTEIEHGSNEVSKYNDKCSKCNAKVGKGIRFCINCGAKRPNNADVCSNCGQKYSDITKSVMQDINNSKVQKSQIEHSSQRFMNTTTTVKQPITNKDYSSVSSSALLQSLAMQSDRSKSENNKTNTGETFYNSFEIKKQIKQLNDEKEFNKQAENNSKAELTLESERRIEPKKLVPPKVELNDKGKYKIDLNPESSDKQKTDIISAPKINKAKDIDASVEANKTKSINTSVEKNKPKSNSTQPMSARKTAEQGVQKKSLDRVQKNQDSITKEQEIKKRSLNIPDNKTEIKSPDISISGLPVGIDLNAKKRLFTVRDAVGLSGLAIGTVMFMTKEIVPFLLCLIFGLLFSAIGNTRERKYGLSGIFTIIVAVVVRIGHFLMQYYGIELLVKKII